jgi:hypothetical protein
MAKLVTGVEESNLATETYVDERLAGSGIGGVTTDDTLHGTGTANSPLGVNVLTKQKLINLLDTAGFPTAFLQQGE